MAQHPPHTVDESIEQAESDIQRINGIQAPSFQAPSALLDEIDDEDDEDEDDEAVPV